MVCAEGVDYYLLLSKEGWRKKESESDQDVMQWQSVVVHGSGRKGPPQREGTSVHPFAGGACVGGQAACATAITWLLWNIIVGRGEVVLRAQHAAPKLLHLGARDGVWERH